MGIAVAVAGAIGVQTVLASTLATDQADRGRDPHRADVMVFHQPDTWDEMNALDDSLRTAPGVTTVHTTLYLWATEVATGTQTFTLTVAPCATLQEIAVIEPCVDRDVFIVPDPLNPSPTPGDRLALETHGGEEPPEWTLPATIRTVPAKDPRLGSMSAQLLATPSALAPMAFVPAGYALSFVWLDPAQADAIEHVRTTVWRTSPTNPAAFSGAKAEQMVTAGRALLPGAAVMMVIIGASLLITQLDQLRERRRVLAGLIAFGTRRRTLAWSVLWQAVIPVGLGLLLAVGAGLTLAWAVLSIAGQASVVDWGRSAP
ncbi:MAG: ABC transporter permease [Micromonosporaceae bacterium]|nr:ABC transporter permease [Micromonosporaceae bacterium]